MAKQSKTPATLNPESGRRLHQLRLARHLTQRELAGGHYSISYVSAIERGRVRPSLGVLEWCAQRLGVSVQDLLPESPGMLLTTGVAGKRVARAAYEQIRAKAAVAAGRFSQARVLLAELRSQFGDAASPELVWYSAYAAQNAGEGAAARADAEHFARLAEERNGAREHAAARLLMGLLHAGAHEPERAVEALRAALALATDAPVDLDFTLAATDALAAAVAERSGGHEALDLLGQAIGAFERFVDPAWRTVEAERRAEQAAASGDFVLACTFMLWTWMSRRVANAHRAGARLYLWRAMVADDAPPLERERDVRRAYEQAMMTGDDAMRLIAAACVVVTLAEAGEAERARQAVAELGLVDLDHFADTSGFARGLVCVAHGWLAHLRADARQAEECATAAVAALEGEREAARPELAYTYAALADLFFRLGDTQRAYATLQRALKKGRRPSSF